jgi:ABC-2 type transport system permease protein
LQWFSRFVPARYYVQGLQTLFLAGDVGSVLIPCSLALLAMSAVLFLLTARSTRTRLD